MSELRVVRFYIHEFDDGVQAIWDSLSQRYLSIEEAKEVMNQLFETYVEVAR